MLKSDNEVDRVPVLVTTAHRGVFFGFADPSQVESKEKIRLTGARNCIFWSKVIGGFLGLAAAGPNADCRIGATVASVLLHDITSVTECSPEAVAAWTR